MILTITYLILALSALNSVFLCLLWMRGTTKPLAAPSTLGSRHSGESRVSTNADAVTESPSGPIVDAGELERKRLATERLAPQPLAGLVLRSDDPMTEDVPLARVVRE